MQESLTAIGDTAFKVSHCLCLCMSSDTAPALFLGQLSPLESNADMSYELLTEYEQ